jgi:hypothetical protein
MTKNAALEALAKY